MHYAIFLCLFLYLYWNASWRIFWCQTHSNFTCTENTWLVPELQAYRISEYSTIELWIYWKTEDRMISVSGWLPSFSCGLRAWALTRKIGQCSNDMISTASTSYELVDGLWDVFLLKEYPKLINVKKIHCTFVLNESNIWTNPPVSTVIYLTGSVRADHSVSMAVNS